MIIRLTSAEAFDKVLEKLKRDPLYSDEANEMFLEYCVSDIREGIAKGNDEWYLDVDWLPDIRVGKVVTILRYHRRSEIMTDVEYLKKRMI